MADDPQVLRKCHVQRVGYLEQQQLYIRKTAPSRTSGVGSRKEQKPVSTIHLLTTMVNMMLWSQGLKHDIYKWKNYYRPGRRNGAKCLHSYYAKSSASRYSSSHSPPNCRRSQLCQLSRDTVRCWSLQESIAWTQLSTGNDLCIRLGAL